MNTNNQLTVIIPSYNEESYIGDTLAGIYKQDFPEKIKVIVADGGSTDNTLKVVERASTVFKDRLEIEVIEGDARVALEEELLNGGSQEYDLLVIDTFSGDTIPLHLLTKEAFDIYLQHLVDGGVIARKIR